MKFQRVLAVGMFLLCLVSCRGEVEEHQLGGSAYVWDIAYVKDPDIDIRPCHEVIYEDEDYYYILGSLESQYYIVTYANGETQNIKEALAEGNITLADLDAYGVHYGKTEKNPAGSESKEIERITDHSGGQVVLTVEERFYEDYSHIYHFGNAVSQYITVTYTDGTEQNVKDALRGGHITVADLDRFGISYFAEPKLIKDIIYHSDRGGEPDALEGFYADENYAYYFPSIRSSVVIVYYRDGTEQTAKEALAEGKIRISDLDWFGIAYYKEPRQVPAD